MESLITGVRGAEGPSVSRDGRLFMVEPSKGRVLEILPGNERREHVNTGGIPAGLQIDRNNDIWIADMKLGILRVDMAGNLYDEVREFEGAPIRGCNDCYFDSMGNLYFSAPAGSNATESIGEVYCRLSNGKVNRINTGYAFSNGLAVTADDKTLIVAETYTRQLHAYDLVEPGQARNKRVWATLPETGLGPDGMDFDVHGRLLVAHYNAGTVEVYNTDGSWSHAIEIPGKEVTNVHFLGSPGSMTSTLLVTEATHGGLWRCEHDAAGQLQYGLMG